MGFFGLFKKKDDFDGMLKDPLTDPLGGLPGDMNSSMPNMNNNNFPRNDLPNFGGNDAALKDETMLNDFSQSQQGMNNGFGMTASPVSTNNSNYASSPPIFRGQNNQGQMKKTEAEVYEEMPVQSKQSLKNDSFSLDKRDVELLNSKLDNIRSQLENLNHRLDNIERGTYDTQTQKRRYAW